MVKKFLFSVKTLDHLPYIESLIDQMIFQNLRVELCYIDEGRSTKNVPRIKSKGVKLHKVKISKSGFWKLRILCFSLFNAKYNTSFYFDRLFNLICPPHFRWLSLFMYGFGKVFPIKLIKRIYCFIPFPHLKKGFSAASLRGFSAVFVAPAVLRGCEECWVIGAAQRASVPVFFIAMTFDSLSTKGLVPQHFEKYFVWGPHHVEDLITRHGISSSRIVQVGSLYHQWILKGANAISEGTRTDAEFDIIWLGSSANICDDEVQVFQQFLGEKIISDELKVAIRMHPSNDWSEKLGESIHDRVTHIDSSLNFDGSSEYLDYLTRARFVIGVNTTALLDAALCGKSVGVVVSAKEVGVRQNSVKHFSDMVRVGRFTKLSSIQDLDSIPDRGPSLDFDFSDAAKNILETLDEL